MREFYIKSTVITFCLIVLSKFFQINMHSHTTNHFEQPKHLSSSASELVYELVNETTRFNKKTGDLEYFIQYSEKDIFKFAGEHNISHYSEKEDFKFEATITGFWKKRTSLWKNKE